MSKTLNDTNSPSFSGIDLLYKLKGGFEKSTKFPVKILPLEDEILSSWFSRLAVANHSNPTTFFNLYFPQHKNYFWSIDIDQNIPYWLLREIAYKARLNEDSVYNMTLRSFEGYVYEDHKIGRNNFISNIKRRGRNNRSYGQKFCPKCLESDSIQYFRKSWRLSLSCICDQHKIWLLDRCQTCGHPVMSYIRVYSDAVPRCHKCKEPFYLQKSSVAPKRAVAAQIKINQIIKEGAWGDCGQIRSLFFFNVVRLFLRVMLGPKKVLMPYRNNEIVNYLKRNGLDNNILDYLDTKIMMYCLVNILSILKDKDKLLSFFVENRFGLTELGYSSLLPFWFYDLIYPMTNSCRAISMDEMGSIIRYMERRNMKISLTSINVLIGTSLDYRKNKAITSMIKHLS